mmetsp:Transcript_22741/g.74251  ORF Transcript_22741/g.74251 Transcript_22741/m.74251 type:complete len:234 (-) Transcript_22741:185-886(-)
MLHPSGPCMHAQCATQGSAFPGHSRFRGRPAAAAAVSAIANMHIPARLLLRMTAASLRLSGGVSQHQHQAHLQPRHADRRRQHAPASKRVDIAAALPRLDAALHAELHQRRACRDRAQRRGEPAGAVGARGRQPIRLKVGVAILRRLEQRAQHRHLCPAGGVEVRPPQLHLAAHALLGAAREGRCAARQAVDLVVRLIASHRQRPLVAARHRRGADCRRGDREDGRAHQEHHR